MKFDGKPVTGSATLGVVNPAIKAVIAQVPDATRIELEAAVDVARAAFPGWAAAPIDARRAALNALGDAVRDQN